MRKKYKSIKTDSNVNFMNRPEEIKNQILTDHDFTKVMRKKRCPKCSRDEYYISGNSVFRHNTLYFDRQCNYCGYTQTYSKSNYEKYYRWWNSHGLDNKIN